MDSYRKTQEQKENISAVFENKVKELIEFDEKDFHELTLKNLKNLKIEYLEYEDEDEALAACLNDNPECDQVAKFDELLDRARSPPELKIDTHGRKVKALNTDDIDTKVDDFDQATFIRWTFESGNEKASKHFFKTKMDEDWKRIQQPKPGKTVKFNLAKKNESMIYLMARTTFKVWFMSILAYFYLCRWIFKRLFVSFNFNLQFCKKLQRVKITCDKIYAFVSGILRRDSQSILYDIMLD